MISLKYSKFLFIVQYSGSHIEDASTAFVVLKDEFSILRLQSILSQSFYGAYAGDDFFTIGRATCNKISITFPFRRETSVLSH